jgi:hypothetical protein
MTKKEFQNYNVTGIFFIVSALLMCIPLYFFLPGNELSNTVWHTYFKYFWLICSACAVYLTGTTRGGFAGAVLCVVFGPITLLTLGFVYLYMKWGERYENS